MVKETSLRNVSGFVCTSKPSRFSQRCNVFTETEPGSFGIQDFDDIVSVDIEELTITGPDGTSIRRPSVPASGNLKFDLEDEPGAFKTVLSFGRIGEGPGVGRRRLPSCTVIGDVLKKLTCQPQVVMPRIERAR